MDSSLTQLCRFYETARHRSQAMVLATILKTQGSTYRKAGARILIRNGDSSGLLSGGCLEADLRERAHRVLQNNRPARVEFDTRNDEDPVWGLGMGCEGAMEVWLEPVTESNGYGPLPVLNHCLKTSTQGMLATVVGGEALADELGRHGFDGHAANDALGDALKSCTRATPGIEPLLFEGRGLEVFVAPLELPTRILLCGAGRDAIPVHTFAAELGWNVTVYDHRPAYASAEHFPQAWQVILGSPDELPRHVDPAGFDAAVIMSHHLPSDVTYLDVLSRANLKFIGLLGPSARRSRILAELGRPLGPMEKRIHGPVGFDIGGTTPESIALAIVAQMHAVLSNRSGGSFDQSRAGL